MQAHAFDSVFDENGDGFECNGDGMSGASGGEAMNGPLETALPSPVGLFNNEFTRPIIPPG